MHFLNGDFDLYRFYLSISSNNVSTHSDVFRVVVNELAEIKKYLNIVKEKFKHIDLYSYDIRENTILEEDHYSLFSRSY